MGGGVAGLSAAHELVERGFQVEVFERSRVPGGKARSVPVYPGVHGDLKVFDLSLERWFQTNEADFDPRTKRDWLPGEHGFRFFPGFYRHVVDTMARIPYGTRSVADNLVPTSALLIARFDRDGIVLPARFPKHPQDIAHLIDAVIKFLAGDLGVPLDESHVFIQKVWQIMTSCDERRRDEYEKIAWWDFIQADEQTRAYQSYFGHGITRSLVAAQARRASTFTIGNTFIQLLFDMADPSKPTSDRVLNGPTNLVWILPWLKYLESRGVIYHASTTVTDISYAGGRIESITVIKGGHRHMVKGDYYVAALPIEQMVTLITPALTLADPALGSLHALAKDVEWMTGILFYLKRRVPLVYGHVIYIDSPWALTSVSHTQFWPDFDVQNFYNGVARDVLSVDISDWNAKGLNGKTMMECTRDEIARETWAQIKRSVNVNGREALKDQDWDHWFLDSDVNASADDRRVIQNREPLLVNHKDTLRLRPDAVTKIPNLFLASDYVRTYTDLATMEAANEAARRAVNGILDASGSSATRCDVWPLQEPKVLEPFREYDRQYRWKEGKPYDARLVNIVQWVLEALRNASGLLPSWSGPFTHFEGPGASSPGAASRVAPGVTKLVEVSQAVVGALTGTPVSPGTSQPTPEPEAPPVAQTTRRRKLRIVQGQT
jgi:uncharacterized protein with NAD-binding domain and iron-sulfur cluster